MTINQNIKGLIVEAMRAKDTIRLDTLRGLNALFVNELIASKAPGNTEFITDDKALALIKRSVKQRQDSIKQFELGKRIDLAEKERVELKILEAFLPKMASKEEIMIVAKKVISESFSGVVDAKSIGKLTGLIMKEMGGNADGNDVKVVAEELTATK